VSTNNSENQHIAKRIAIKILSCPSKALVGYQGERVDPGGSGGGTLTFCRSVSGRSCCMQRRTNLWRTTRSRGPINSRHTPH